MHTKILAVFLADVIKKREWLYDENIPQAIFSRMMAYGFPIEWHAFEPSERYPHLEHKHFVNKGKKQKGWMVRLKGLIFNSGKMPDTGWKAKFLPYGGRISSYEESISYLVTLAREQDAEFIALINDHDAAMVPEAIQMAMQIAMEQKAGLVYCSQIEGIFPIVVSKAFLEKWLAKESFPDPRSLYKPEGLSEFGKIVDVELVQSEELQGKIRCTPLDLREKWMLPYWEEHAKDLIDAFSQNVEEQGTARHILEKVMGEYRSKFVYGLETYHVVGTLSDVDELRQQMMVTEKPVMDYFVIATHYGLFLQKYAGLKPDSHVVDIGCSWGYLGFALANFLNEDGSYLGVEVQPQPVAWAKRRLDWLGSNFQFVLMDIQNDYYNPDGKTPRSQVKMPIPDGWANVIILGSVFTHMQEDGVQNYLNEFHRILAHNGIAAFSYDDTTYWSHGDEYFIVHKNQPDKSTFFSREKIKQMVEKAGLKTAREPVNMLQFDRTDYQTWYFAKR